MSLLISGLRSTGTTPTSESYCIRLSKTGTCSSGCRFLSKVPVTEGVDFAQLPVGVASANDDTAFPRHRGLEGPVGGLLVALVRLAFDVAVVAVVGGEGLGVAVPNLLTELHRQSQRAETGKLQFGAVLEDRVVHARSR